MKRLFSLSGVPPLVSLSQKSLDLRLGSSTGELRGLGYIDIKKLSRVNRWERGAPPARRQRRSSLQTTANS